MRSVPRYSWLLTPVLGLVLAPVPAQAPALFAWQDPAPAASPPSANSTDVEANRQLLQKWKADPEHYARLQRDLRDFWTLPKGKRQRLRQLDQDVHKLDAKTRKRLWKVAERYSLWLEQLPDSDRRRLDAAAVPEERLRVVKEIRERQWLDHLPHTIRDQLLKLPPAERTAQVALLRDQERKQRKLWQRPLESPPLKHPVHLREFPKDVQEFVKTQLRPHLTPEERQLLMQADKNGKGPQLAKTIWTLAERHPVLPPRPAPHRPITRYEELSAKGQQIAGAKQFFEIKTEEWRKLRQVEGEWPEWALRFVNMLTLEQRKAMPPLGASRPKEFPAPVQEFIDSKLSKALNAFEKQRLKSKEGKWPDYPRLLLELAHKHNLQVPGMSLPGPQEIWEQARKR